MIESLGLFDRQVAEELFAIHPEWQAFARAEDDCGENALIVSLRAPNPRIKEPLVITTEEQEVSVFFDTYHGHFNELNDGALSLAEKITSDQYSIVSFWRDAQFCCSSLCENSALPSSNDDYPYANRIVFRSWSGEHDKELSCIGRD
ncbi:hypothetical protein GCM10027046_24690 [Uliginosibacterium flavum]|uniref:Uncharacterized protein n=1 Tax=Uliginosibacterium flavum TaxID=1396831 RepID=A0ABV2TKF3_9RHOO